MKKGASMKKAAAQPGDYPSRLIDASIKALDDWRGETLARIRELFNVELDNPTDNATGHFAD